MNWSLVRYDTNEDAHSVLDLAGHLELVDSRSWISEEAMDTIRDENLWIWTYGEGESAFES